MVKKKTVVALVIVRMMLGFVAWKLSRRRTTEYLRTRDSILCKEGDLQVLYLRVLTDLLISRHDSLRLCLPATHARPFPSLLGTGHRESSRKFWHLMTHWPNLTHFSALYFSWRNKWLIFRRFNQNCEKWLLALLCLAVRSSVCPPTWNNSFPTGRIFIKFKKSVK